MESRNSYDSSSWLIYSNPITGKIYQIPGNRPNSRSQVSSNSRNTREETRPEKSSSGFGYFLAAAVGFVAALVTRSLLFDEPE